MHRPDTRSTTSDSPRHPSSTVATGLDLVTDEVDALVDPFGPARDHDGARIHGNPSGSWQRPGRRHRSPLTILAAHPGNNGATASVRPGLGQKVTGVGQELWQRLGAPDDRHEVLVAGPARNDMLVQVG